MKRTIFSICVMCLENLLCMHVCLSRAVVLCMPCFEHVCGLYATYSVFCMSVLNMCEIRVENLSDVSIK